MTTTVAPPERCVLNGGILVFASQMGRDFLLLNPAQTRD